MRIILSGYSIEHEIAYAIEHKLEPDAYSYTGALEKAERKISNCAEMIGKIVQILNEKKIMNNEEVMELLGYGYEEVK